MDFVNVGPMPALMWLLVLRDQKDGSESERLHDDAVKRLMTWQEINQHAESGMWQNG